MTIYPLRITSGQEVGHPRDLWLTWSNEESYLVSYVDLRFHCPCASCIDEKTGQRIIERTDVTPEVRPLRVNAIGRYAITFEWSDQHYTGIYHFDRLYEICTTEGSPFSLPSPETTSCNL